MNTSDLQYKLNEIRSEAVEIINEVLDDAGIIELNLQDVGTGNYPMTHEEGECACLQNIKRNSDGNLLFESDSEFNTIYDGEDNLSADVLVKIAMWMKENEEDIAELGKDSPLEEDEYEEED